MGNKKYSSIGSATASDIRNIKKPGILLPIRSRDEKLAVFPWEEQTIAMTLTGSHSFIYFPISLESPHQGLFISDAEILVDFDSATNGLGKEDCKGLLVLEQNKLSVIGERAGNGFGDPHLVPLWLEIDGGSEAAKVAFERWSIGVREGDDYRILWEYELKTGSD